MKKTCAFNDIELVEMPILLIVKSFVGSCSAPSQIKKSSLVRPRSPKYRGAFGFNENIATKETPYAMQRTEMQSRRQELWGALP